MTKYEDLIYRSELLTDAARRASDAFCKLVFVQKARYLEEKARKLTFSEASEQAGF